MNVQLQEKLKKYRLNEAEYKKMVSLLEREPQGVEWALFSALWSEHCSYKSSKVHLKELYNSSSRVLQSFGENAGVIDLGEGERIAFKMESHNHPSFIEPYQGAATGVGGILRDVFTMGARPIFLANYLCFGSPKAARQSSLVNGVVRGIGGYGNCVGVPTITGQTEFHSSYDKNILVNAFALGLFRKNDPICLSQAKGVGNYIVYVGAKTGRDGVHGASMASESFDQDSESKRPTVQIGDPFFEKLLIESCLEVMKEDLVVAIQDMGAAGLTSSSFEMAAKGNVGFDIDLSKVPLRDSTLTPEDILLSESQERMLLICEPRKFERIAEIFHHWDLDACIIGEVTKEQTVKLRWKNEILTEIDPHLLTDHAPYYMRDFKPWKAQNRVECDGDIETIEYKNPKDLLLQSLSSAQGCNREWIYNQYDQRVGGCTARDCSSDIGVSVLPDSKRALGVVLGCRPHIMRFDAQIGGYDSIAYPALELALKGFEPLGVTDCLNFGNPEKIEIMSEFVASLRAMSEQCKEIEAPIISGNVSFYNETEKQNITSTPSTGLVGLKSTYKDIPQSVFTEENLSVFVLSDFQLILGGMLQELKEGKSNGWGEFDSKRHAKFIKFTRDLVNEVPIEATKIVGKYGLAYTLARMSLEYDMGIKVKASAIEKWYPHARDWFMERLYEAIIVVKEKDKSEFVKFFETKRRESHLAKLELIELGITQKNQFQIGSFIKTQVHELQQAYNKGWELSFETLA